MEIVMQEKQPQNATYGDRHVPYIFKKLFSWAAFLSLIVCLYLQPFTSYKALKLTILKIATEMQHIWLYHRCPWGLPPRAVSFQTALCMSSISIADIVWLQALYVASLKSYQALLLTMLQKYSKMKHVWSYGEGTNPRYTFFQKARSFHGYISVADLKPFKSYKVELYSNYNLTLSLCAAGYKKRSQKLFSAG